MAIDEKLLWMHNGAELVEMVKDNREQTWRVIIAQEARKERSTAMRQRTIDGARRSLEEEGAYARHSHFTTFFIRGSDEYAGTR